MSAKACCMVMRLNIDCNACCRKLVRIILKMKEIETHMIDKPHYQVSVCGRFRPSDVAIKLSKKMKRRVAILDIEEMGEERDQYMYNPYDASQGWGTTY